MKKFGFWTGWFVVVASMVGSGILTNSGPILRSTGSYLGLLLIWAVGAVLALCGAFTLSEVASGIPKAGGDYTYVRVVFGPSIGFTYGWAMAVIGFAAPIALVAYTTASYLFPAARSLILHQFPAYDLNEASFTLIFATVLISTLTVSHCLGHQSSSRVQAVTTLFNFLLLLFLGCILVLSPGSNWSSFSAGKSVFSSRISLWGTHLILVLYAYTGWNAAAYLAGEMKDAARTLPRCLIFGCLAVALLYLLVNIGYAVALSPTHLQSLSDNEWNRLAEVAVHQQFGPAAARVFSICVSLGVMASLSAFILTGPRIVYAMAHDGLFPAFAGKLHPKTEVPVFAILVQGILSLLFLWTGTFQQILDFAGYGLSVIGVLAVLPIFWLRGRSDFRPQFRVPAYPWVPLVFVGVSTFSLIGGLMENPGPSLLSVICICAGFPLYLILQKWMKVRG